MIRLLRDGEAAAGDREDDAAFAYEHGLLHLPPGRLAEAALDRVPGGEPVLVRGAGPALADLLAPLTVGRGGGFRRGPGGRLTYAVGGHEPLVHVVSRRGVPYHARIEYPLRGGPPPVGGFLRDLPDGPLDHRRDVWPLIAKELTYAYYHELLTAHPERARMTWDEFAEAYAAEPWDGKAMRALIRRAVPGYADRLNLARLDRPLAGIRFGDSAGLQRWVHGYIAADLARRGDPAHSADLAMVHGMFSVLGMLAKASDIDPSFTELVGFVAGGPSAARLEELLALARAGIVTFVGAEGRVVADPVDGVWRAGSLTVPGHVRARVLIETPAPTWPAEADVTPAPPQVA
ncbi:hypothetical protein AB0K60_08720 [Thermopolyspora sp. NPDC052614]|uniref:hypothetical protein n=1 Tax=Thermopolyspora sp. NPDC052614 TaxID=3155682 RepID=UPI003427F59A